VICLRAKAVDFKVTYINLREKPDWFLKISPHGKVPVLSVDEQPLFESNAIAEYLDETVVPRLHPEDPIKRARNRAWTDFVPDFASSISGVYYAKTAQAASEAMELARVRLGRVEKALEERGNDGPFFNGTEMSMVDCSYAPFLQRFGFVEKRLQTGLLQEFPKVQAWADALLADERVIGSVADSFPEAFKTMLQRRESHAAPLFEAA
jgi:glutathione S-transferase